MKEIKYILNKLVWVAYVSLWWVVLVFPDKLVIRASWFSDSQDAFPLGIYALAVWTIMGFLCGLSYVMQHWNDDKKERSGQRRCGQTSGLMGCPHEVDGRCGFNAGPGVKCGHSLPATSDKNGAAGNLCQMKWRQKMCLLAGFSDHNSDCFGVVFPTFDEEEAAFSWYVIRDVDAGEIVASGVDPTMEAARDNCEKRLLET